VLVPRPETELLAEFGWSFLSTVHSERSTALDFGTGSGCIAIALAAKTSAAKITALDISAEALNLAKQNAAKNNVADRIEFVQGDGFNAFLSGTGVSPVRTDSHGQDARATIHFDLIISNPPYISTAEIAALDPEVRDYDPRGALDGGADGLDFYRRLATEARSFLKPGGKIMLEFGDGQGEAIREIFTGQNWIVEAIRDDYTQRQRILIAK